MSRSVALVLLGCSSFADSRPPPSVDSTVVVERLEQALDSNKQEKQELERRIAELGEAAVKLDLRVRYIEDRLRIARREAPDPEEANPGDDG